MAFPTPPNSQQPIPNNSFYYPETNYIKGEYGPFIVGGGIYIDNLTGTLSAGGTGPGGISTILPGSGIFVSANTGGVVTVTNTGVLTLTAGVGISISGSGGNLTISNTNPAPVTPGTVTRINTGTGLTGGPITSTGTVALAPSGVGPGTYTNPTITVDQYGRITFATPSLPPGGSSVTATLPLRVTTGTPQNISIDTASSTVPGVVQLNSAVNSNSTTEAATPAAVKQAYDLAASSGSSSTTALATANTALSTANSACSIALNAQSCANQALINAAAAQSTANQAVTNAAVAQTTAAAAQAAANARIPCAAFLAKGNLLAGTGSGAFSVLPAGANDYLLAADNTTGSGLKWVAPPPVAVTSVTGTSPITIGGTATSPVVGVLAASTSTPGAVQLYDGLDSTSTTQALTANQGYLLQQQINAVSLSSNITLAGTIDASTGFLLTVTDEGITAGFTVGSTLPAPAAGNDNFFVIVTTQGTMTPPGGSAQFCHVGDWWLSNGIAWQFIDAGFQPGNASTTSAGIVELATTAETQAGTDGSLAITPSGAAATYIPLSCLTAKGTIISATSPSTASALPVGTNGQILYACSLTSTGLCWATPSFGTLTSVTAGTGLSGGTITSSGTISIPTSGVTAGTYTNSTFSVNSLGIVTSASSGVAAIPCSCIVSKGSLITGTSANTPSPLPAGANGQILYSCTTASSGLCWAAPPSVSIATATTLGLVYGCTTNTHRISIGAGSLQNATGTFNSAFGDAIMSGPSMTGSSNTGVAYGALGSLTSGEDNTSVGVFSSCYLTTGFCNTALGKNALRNNISGNCNTALGMQSLNSTTGSGNTALGFQAGCSITSGSNNVVIGPQAQVVSNVGSCQLAIGWGTGFGASCNWLTGDSTKAIRPGAGIIDCAGSCGTTGQILTSNGANAVVWATPSSNYALFKGAGQTVTNVSYHQVNLSLIQSSGFTVSGSNVLVTTGKRYYVSAALGGCGFSISTAGCNQFCFYLACSSTSTIENGFTGVLALPASNFIGSPTFSGVFVPAATGCVTVCAGTGVINMSGCYMANLTSFSIHEL